MDAAHKPTDSVAVCTASEEEAKRVIGQNLEACVREEKSSLHIARRDIELSDRDVETILDAAAVTSPVVARLKKNPYLAPTRLAVASQD